MQASTVEKKERERKEILWKYVLINLCKTVDTSAVLKIITLDDFLVEENASEREKKMYINEGIDGWSMNEMESGNGQERMKWATKIIFAF